VSESDFRNRRLLSPKELRLHDIDWAGLCGATFAKNIKWDNVLFTKNKYGKVHAGAAAPAAGAAGAIGA